MKTILTASIFFVYLSLSIVTAQVKPEDDPKYGADPASRIECVKNLSLYKEYVKQKNFADAYKPWHDAYTSCPQSTKNIYMDGTKLYKNFIKSPNEAPFYKQMIATGKTDRDVQEACIDSLMAIYDKRMKFFQEEDFNYGLKGLDLLLYRESALKDAYNLLAKSVDGLKSSVPPAFIDKYMQASKDLFKKNGITDAEVVENFTKSMEYLEEGLKTNNKKLQSSKSDTKKAQKIEETIADIYKTINNVELYFSSSGAASCEALIKIFTPRFEAAPQDLKLLKKITKLLDKTDCTDSELYTKASENLYKIEPSPQAAYNIAQLFVKKDDHTKAIEYYTKAAAELEEGSDDILKANCYYKLGVLALAQKQFSKARNYAYDALKLNNSWGKPYLVIGNAYAASSNDCNENEFTKKTVFWAAVDKFIQARDVDESVKEQADKLIATYKKYFPKTEDAFFYDVKKGDTYEVGCWIKEKTKARFVDE